MMPFSFACFAMEAALEISSYEEFVQEPIRQYSKSVGQPLRAAASFILDTGVYKSGVNGPFNAGSKVERSISIT